MGGEAAMGPAPPESVLPDGGAYETAVVQAAVSSQRPGFKRNSSSGLGSVFHFDFQHSQCCLL